MHIVKEVVPPVFNCTDTTKCNLFYLFKDSEKESALLI